MPVDEHEYADENHSAGAKDPDRRGSPGVSAATEARHQDERGRGQGQHCRAGVVDDVMHTAEPARHLTGDHDERNQPDRHVDVEDPAPGQVVDEHPAEQRAHNARHAEDGTEQAHVAAAFAGRDDVADDRLRADHQTTAAEALDRAERDELDHGVAEPGQNRAGEEDHDRGLEEDLPAVLVAELAPQRGRHGGCQQVRGDKPGDVRAAPEVTDDRRQRGRDDGLVQRREQHAEHQRADDEQDRAAAQTRQGAVTIARSACARGQRGAIPSRAHRRGSPGGRARQAHLMSSVPAGVGSLMKGVPGSRLPGQVSQRTVLGEPVGESLEGGIDELVKRHNAAAGGPKGHDGPHAAGERDLRIC
jgi:hypothetical protein